MATDRACALTVTAAEVKQAKVLAVSGVLDTTTYLILRNEIIKAALEEPVAVIIDITELSVPAETALAVFTSARWHVGRWPEVPIALACAHADGRHALARNGVLRYVPVYSTIDDALAAVSDVSYQPARRRARAELPADETSLARTRELVAEWLTAWSRTELIAVTKVISTTLIENVLKHTDSAPRLRLEVNGSAVTVAVEDTSQRPAGLREEPAAVGRPSGLGIVAALSRVWGISPMPSGKTVWAVIGPENQL